MLQPDYHETSFTNEWRFLGALAGALNRAQDALANATISWHCQGHAVMARSNVLFSARYRVRMGG